jgi:acyl carrier protein
MNRADIQKIIIDILEKEMGLVDGSVALDQTRESLGLDSLDDFEILMWIEEECGVDILDEEWVALTTVSDMVELVAGKIL